MSVIRLDAAMGNVLDIVMGLIRRILEPAKIICSYDPVISLS